MKRFIIGFLIAAIIGFCPYEAFAVVQRISSGASSVGGSSGDIQYNNSGAFGGITPGTGVVTALGVNVGSAGSPVLFNGAGGTPSSITLTNAGGTASSLIAGAVSVPAALGSSTATTQTSTDNSTKLATTAFVQAAKAGTSIKTLGFSTGAAATGQQGSYAIAPCAGTITAWDIVANAGTATFSVWKIATGTTAPTSGNSINTSGVALASGTAIHSTTLSDFTTTTVAANDIIAFNVSATSGATLLYGDIQITCTN